VSNAFHDDKALRAAALKQFRDNGRPDLADRWERAILTLDAVPGGMNQRDVHTATPDRYVKVVILDGLVRVAASRGLWEEVVDLFEKLVHESDLAARETLSLMN